MYAILETGGRQYKVRQGEVLDVERLDAEPGADIELDRVLLISGDDGKLAVGRPFVPGAKVVAEVVDQIKGEKIIVFKYKAKVRYRRKTGHRQRLTRIRIKDILGEA